MNLMRPASPQTLSPLVVAAMRRMQARAAPRRPTQMPRMGERGRIFPRMPGPGMPGVAPDPWQAAASTRLMRGRGATGWY